MSNVYDDIINIKTPIPLKHKRMPKMNRAAQFAPFAALTSHEEVIKETEHIVCESKDVVK